MDDAIIEPGWDHLSGAHAREKWGMEVKHEQTQVWTGARWKRSDRGDYAAHMLYRKPAQAGEEQHFL